MTSTSPVNDITSQARQGSVAAIIQVLNEHLADSGIRTRAVLADGILQLLCEAPTPEDLPQSQVVDRVRGILEGISPRNIRRVNINSRIVREQQLLWLEEIHRDPEGQLLWSELIVLKQPNAIARLIKEIQTPKARPKNSPANLKRTDLKQQYFWRGIVGGASLCLLVVMVGWALKYRLGIQWSPAQTVSAPELAPEESPAVPAAVAQDAFVQAVRLAEQASIDGQTAETAADWLDLAARWQRASDLMAEVPPDDSRYKTAQDRVILYQQYRAQALTRSEQSQPPAAE
jgi:hypothetical protein